jgi:hypothetical protein
LPFGIGIVNSGIGISLNANQKRCGRNPNIDKQKRKVFGER